MDKCPLTSQPCQDERACPLWVKLEDYEGCPFDLADKAIQNLRDTVILPAAAQLDEIVGDFFRKKQ